MPGSKNKGSSQCAQMLLPNITNRTTWRAKYASY